MDLFPVQQTLFFFFFSLSAGCHAYQLTVVSHSVLVGRTAVNLDRKVTWPHSKSSNSYKHTHPPTQVCVCVLSKYFQGDNMGIYEALYPLQ